MNIGIIPMRYAKALYAFAQDKSVEEKVYAEMSLLAHSFAEHTSLKTVLDNPVMKSKEKQSLICTAAGTQVSDVFVRFIELVLHQKREKHLQSIALMYQDLYRKAKLISIGSLVTASPLSTETEDHMRKLLMKDKKGTLDFKTSVDPEIMGGFIFSIDTYRLDASIATQLRRVKSQFMDKNRKSI
ncbi:F0F1 ATP synthase subunit delta [uncultured Bacteroides sp.]|uniref:F0F1 ATP synthase subunit delta n=1 Tax=uncultured Bacteroides sp. TaxID=162156 RepID=UPI002AAACB34|nr:F0F1 ATP synthase subunit delta [uncultured Bacteroides sp.]